MDPKKNWCHTKLLSPKIRTLNLSTCWTLGNSIHHHYDRTFPGKLGITMITTPPSISTNIFGNIHLYPAVHPPNLVTQVFCLIEKKGRKWAKVIKTFSSFLLLEKKIPFRLNESISMLLGQLFSPLPEFRYMRGIGFIAFKWWWCNRYCKGYKRQYPTNKCVHKDWNVY